MTALIVILWVITIAMFFYSGQVLSYGLKVQDASRYQMLGKPGVLNRFGGAFVAFVLQRNAGRYWPETYRFWIAAFRVSAVLLFTMTIATTAEVLL